MADVEDRLERALCPERQPYPHFAGRALAVKVATRIFNKRRDGCGPGPGHGWGLEFLRVKSRASLGASFGLKVGFKFPHKEEMWLLARAAACKKYARSGSFEAPIPTRGTQVSHNILCTERHDVNVLSRCEGEKRLATLVRRSG